MRYVIFSRIIIYDVVGLCGEICNVLMYYNPMWLRIGLESVLGENLTSYSLTNIIKQVDNNTVLSS